MDKKPDVHINMKKADMKLISDQVKEEVDNVQSMLKELLKKKIEWAEGIQQSVKPDANLVNNDYTQMMQKYQDDFADLQVEMTTAPSGETVRRLRGILANMAKELKPLPTADVKILLDMAYNFIPLTMVQNYKEDVTKRKQFKYSGSDKLIDLSGTGGNKKGNEVRRLCMETIFKWLKDNSLKYLGKNPYPETYIEMSTFFDETNPMTIAEKMDDESSKNFKERGKLHTAEDDKRWANLEKEFRNFYKGSTNFQGVKLPLQILVCVGWLIANYPEYQEYNVETVIQMMSGADGLELLQDTKTKMFDMMMKTGVQPKDLEPYVHRTLEALDREWNA